MDFEMVPLTHYLFLSATLFVIGVTGVLVKRNAIVVFMSIEIMLNAVNISLIAFDRYMNLHDGQVFSLMSCALPQLRFQLGLQSLSPCSATNPRRIWTNSIS